MAVDPFPLQNLQKACLDFREGHLTASNLQWCVALAAYMTTSVEDNRLRRRLDGLEGALDELNILYDHKVPSDKALEVVQKIEELLRTELPEGA